MTYFIKRVGDYVLWQKGHYHYHITESKQPYRLVMDLVDMTCEEALVVLNDTH
jgi:hypothetical protein